MPAYVALLRGVNIGRSQRVPMAEFRAVLAELGHTRVATLLNSGNAVFHARSRSAARLATGIAAGLHARLGLAVPVIVKSAHEFASIVDELPFRVDDSHHSQLLVAFTPSRDDLASLATIAPLVVAEEAFAIGTHAAYLWCAHGVLESAAGAALLGRAGRLATTRNWATVRKLHARLAAIRA